ncbi:hypothetical protein HOU70_gp38 [Arthrobacter phage Liebe]|uniref:Uncharacterized protein n=2 Tax=Arthrobacter virus Liebe TaxID=2734245 RepID=A0A3G2KHR5_9CAUD|nr:hypothetical protein HOU70_gp38 [Arthrobacter phage Liebe]AYN58519.1 hypothetical protein PBI_MAUREEN_38 [Arthrobacter phage Maureen]AZF93771.1 hypothetical protein PBI_LIEBE_38 [Arthrobacter phage Liebe]
MKDNNQAGENAGTAVSAPPDPGTYVLVPVLDEADSFYTVFGDGSYVRDWRPVT